jgi:ribose transport system permease protein
VTGNHVVEDPGSGSPLATARAARRVWRDLINYQVFVVLALFVLVLAFLSLVTETFLTRNNLAGFSRNFAWLAVVSLGESLVIIIGGIDLSVGATMALAGLVAARCMQIGVSPPLAILIGLTIGVVMGLINGTLVAQVRLPPFIVTLGTMSIGRGIAYGLTKGWSISNLPESFLRFGQSDVGIGPVSVPFPLLITLGVALALAALLKYTVIGSDIYAMTSGEKALFVSGVNVIRLKVFVYTLCGVLAAIAGLMIVARLGVAAPAAAIGYEVDAVAAAVIGGTSLFGGVGSVIGVLLGAAITQMIYNGLVLLGYPSYWQTAAIGAMMLMSVLLDYWRRRR